MCGISGIINQTQREVNRDEIKKINTLIVHRGPDDEGFFFEKSFAFGHRRLSILDLSSDGHQPMHYLDRYTIIYNGEVYNYLEIKEELQSYGYTFHSHTDTEVILASYDKWGEECVSRFNGMWAFAIYDKEKNSIFCSRDRFGIKPFYYTEVNGKFIFGSEIKQLLEFHETRYVNKSVLMDYLITGYEEYQNETFFENIYKLEQSHNLIYDLDRHAFKIKRYYDIEIEEKIKALSEDESISKYREKLKESIALRLRSDVTVGTCLSGGLDSSSVASIASDLYSKGTDKQFKAIHAKSTDSKTDESLYAKEVAKHCAMDLRVVEPTTQEFIDTVDEVIYTQEEPFGGPSIFMQYFVMQEAKRLECKVMLDGQGGDETLLGYEKYYPAYLISLDFWDRIKGFFNSSKNSKLTIKQLLSYFIYFTNAKIRTKRLRQKNSFIKEKYLDMLNRNIIEVSSENYLDIFKLQYGEIYATKMPHLLKYEDKNSMRHSIEIRLPFIDYRLLEIALSVNNSFKIKAGWTKYILRKSVEKILPKSIVWRKNKFGFEAPTDSWMSGIENEMKESIEKSKIVSEICNDIDFGKLNSIQKWKLFNIAKWEEIYRVKIN